MLFHKPYEKREIPKLCPVFRIQFLEEFSTAERGSSSGSFVNGLDDK